MDYNETLSPVARLNSIWILFSVVINMGWPLFQLDVKNVFLYRDLKDEVYMEQPPGYVAQEENTVCRLRKAIYRLKQSSRACLRSSAWLFLVLNLHDVIKITRCLFIVLSLAQ